MSSPVRWANVERHVVQHLQATVTSWTFTETTTQVPDEYLKVERVGGNGSWVDKTVDIEVAVHARTRDRMWELAADVETVMHLLAASAAAGLYVDDIVEMFSFAVDPLPNVRRATATYTLTVRPSA